jgi:hypothetical protein
LSLLCNSIKLEAFLKQKSIFRRNHWILLMAPVCSGRIALLKI